MKERQPVRPDIVTCCLRSMKTIHNERCSLIVASLLITIRHSRIASLKRPLLPAVHALDYTIICAAEVNDYDSAHFCHTVRTTGLSENATGKANHKAVTSWCQNHPGYAMISESSEHRLKRAILSTISISVYGLIFFQETKEICMIAALTNTVCGLRSREYVIKSQPKLFKHVLVGIIVASMTENVPRLCLHM